MHHHLDNLGYTTATAAAISPIWLPKLQQISEVASDILPILGVMWLLFQIIVKVVDYRTQRKRDRRSE